MCIPAIFVLPLSTVLCQSDRRVSLLQHEIGNANSPEARRPLLAHAGGEVCSSWGDWIEDTGDEAKRGEREREKAECQGVLLGQE